MSPSSAAAGRRCGPHLYFESPDSISPLPRKDPEWQKYNVIRRGKDGKMTVEARKPVPPNWELVQKIDA